MGKCTLRAEVPSGTAVVITVFLYKEGVDLLVQFQPFSRLFLFGGGRKCVLKR